MPATVVRWWTGNAARDVELKRQDHGRTWLAGFVDQCAEFFDCGAAHGVIGHEHAVDGDLVVPVLRDEPSTRTPAGRSA